MVLNGTIEHEELTLVPVDGFDTIYEEDTNPLPVFIFGDDEDLDDDEEFEDEDDYEDEEEEDDFDYEDGFDYEEDVDYDEFDE
jgi:hypothetical protein